MKPAIKLLLIQFLLIGGFVVFIIAWKINSSKQNNIFFKASQIHYEEIIDQVFANHIDQYSRPLNDNSEWDETVDYIKKRSSEFENVNLNTLLQTFSINGVWVFNAEGKEIYSINDSSNTLLNNLFSNLNVRKIISAEKSKCHFFHVIDNNLFELFGATVVPTFDIKHRSSPKGYLFFVKSWDTTIVNHFAKITSTMIKLNYKDFFTVKDEDDDILFVHRHLLDWKGSPIAEITSVKTDPLVREWIKTAEQLLVIIIIFGIVYIFFVGFLFHKLISRPLFIEISERKHAEEEILRLNKSLENSVKKRTTQLETVINELESFSYSISHDLRAPVRIIDNFSKILLDDHGDSLNADGKKIINLLTETVKNMDQLIVDLLAFSKLNRQDIIPVRIKMQKMAGTVFNELVFQSDKNKIKFTITPIPDSDGDSTMIRQVWRNLIGNAIKFSSNRPAPEIEIGSWKENDEIIYYIRDNGVGFNMAYVDKIFGVFQRLHSSRDFEGTGVGLAIVQQVIHRHNGRVWAEGKENEGAAFYFSLPGESG